MILLNRLLMSSGGLVARNALPLKTGQKVRGYKHVVSVPARNPLSTGEKIVFCALMGVGLWAVPFWILYHLPDYQKEDRHTYTGRM